MYCRLLEEAIQDLRGENLSEPLWPIEIRLPATQLIPDDYIPIESQRIRFYKDIAAARTHDSIELLTDELVDRYGSLPQPAVSLIAAARLRIAASPWKIDTIRPGLEGTIRITSANHALELATAFAERAAAGRKVFSKLRRQGDVIILSIRETDEEFTPEEILAALADYVEAIATQKI